VVVSRTTRPPFGAHGERQVSGAADLWFRNGGCAPAVGFAAFSIINRKFTPNRIFAIFCKFSPNLVQ
jgi:hypothetical protein